MADVYAGNQESSWLPMDGDGMGATGETPLEGDTASLERAKFRLLQEMARDKKMIAELEEKTSAAQAKLAERKARLGEYNALFMTCEDPNARAPRQKLGATQAVLGTKRIIERELGKLSKEIAVTEMKLNKTRDRNLRLREEVNTLRKEGLTFKKLFGAMGGELGSLKAKVADMRAAIEEGYRARDAAQEAMRELAKRFEIDKAERASEWSLFGEAIEAANAEGLPESLQEKTGVLTQEEEDALRKKIKKGQQKMARDRAVLAVAGEKLRAYGAALSTIRKATGYDHLEDLAALFATYEEDKFAKVAAANRMVMEIERLERDVAAMRGEVASRQASNEALKAARAATIASLEASAAEVEGQVAEQDAAGKRMLAEVKGLYRVIEFAFHATGCDWAFEEDGVGIKAGPGTTAAAGGAAGGAGGIRSPLRSKTASLKMYNSPGMRADVRGGLSSVTGLSQFMGIVENKAADIIQQYAALVSAPDLSASLAPAMAAGGAGGGFGSTQDSARSGGASSPAASARSGGYAVGSGGAASRFLSPSALGPPKPTGRLKESITSSALVAALAVETARMELPGEGPGEGGSSGGGGGEGDEVKPISVAELKRQAVAQLNTDKTFRTVRSAASIAATVLTRS